MSLDSSTGILSGTVQSPTTVGVNVEVTDTQSNMMIAPVTIVIATAPVQSGSTINFSDEEVPGGTVNGVNAVFTLANTPIVPSLKVYRNGVRMKNGTDYNLSGQTITFVAGEIPQDTDILVVDYRY
jgi:hypothetical protein